MPETDNIIRIPESVCTKLGVAAGQSVTVAVGNRNVRARIVSRGGDTDKSQETALLSERLTAALNIPGGMKRRYRETKKKLPL